MNNLIEFLEEPIWSGIGGILAIVSTCISIYQLFSNRKAHRSERKNYSILPYIIIGVNGFLSILFLPPFDFYKNIVFCFIFLVVIVLSIISTIKWFDSLVRGKIGILIGLWSIGSLGIWLTITGITEIFVGDNLGHTVGVGFALFYAIFLGNRWNSFNDLRN